MKNYSIYIKRLMIFLIVLVMAFAVVPVSGSEKGPIEKADGSGFVTHRGSSEYIQVNKVYEEKATEFRGVWVSPLVGNLNKYISKDQYKNEIISILNTMDYYNMNVMIFHIRIMNDAFYKSNYNNWSTYYSENPDWEALSWIIEECHKRGIEFHAWMNPYRVTNNVAYASNLEGLSKKFPVLNPASNPDNLLVGKNSIILNPGLGSVQDFLLNTCMEVVENYDIDAIHFDDYFYDSGVDDSELRNSLGISNSQMPDWRRAQVDSFIENLSKSIRKYNQENGKSIQLGISPSGVWKSGNGKVTYDANGNAITSGSNTATTFEHYGDYLYSDTLKWINEEWIDYILPQTYWAVEHPLCAYYDLLDWWSKVVEHKKVKLYSGIGLYQSSSSSTYSWYTNPKEMYNQTMICNTLSNVEGTAIFDYSAVKSTINNPSNFVGMKDIWDTPKILPEIENTTRVVPTKVSNLTVNKNSVGNLLTWDETDDAKFYVVYRSKDEITYSPTEVIDIIGHLGSNGKIEYTDLNANNNDEYYYAVKPQSYSLTLGHGTSVKLSLENTTSELATLGEFTLVNINDVVIPGASYYVFWEKITYPYGNPITYQLYYSINDSEEKLITDFVYENYQYMAEIPTSEDSTKIKIRLRASNNVGETNYIYESNLSKGLGKVNNFSCLGNLYANQDVDFVWTLLDVEEADYTLQLSYDMANWEDVKARQIVGEASAKLTCKLPKNPGAVYYRVMACKDNEYGYSDVLKLDVVQYLGNFKNFKINGNDVEDYYLIYEDEVLEITFDKFTQENVTYNASVSADLNVWQTGRQYNNKFSVDANSSNVVVKFPIKYVPLKIYVKITATSPSGATESEIFEIYVMVYYNWFEDVLDSLDKSVEGYVNELDIYN